MSQRQIRRTAMWKWHTFNTARSSLKGACAVWLLVASIFAISSIRTAAQIDSAHTPKPLGTPLDVTVPIDPTAFKAGGKWHLVYELHVANLGKWDCELVDVEVLREDTSSKSLAIFADAALDAIMFHPGLESAGKTVKTAKKSIISPGALAVVYMWVTLDSLEDVPTKICHRVVMRIGDYPEAITLEG